MSLRKNRERRSDLFVSYLQGEPRPEHEHPHDAHDAEFHRARGHETVLTSARPARLLPSLRAAEAAAFGERPVALAVSPHTAHTAVQVVLRDATVLSYVFARDGGIARVYTDDSARRFCRGAPCSAAAVGADRLLLGMEAARLVAALQSGRDKAKRPYVTAKAGVAREVETPERKARSLSVDSSGSLVAVMYAQRLCVFGFDHVSAAHPPPPPAGAPPRAQSRLALDMVAQTRLEGGGRFVRAEFDAAAPRLLFLAYELAGRAGFALAHAWADAASGTVPLPARPFVVAPPPGETRVTAVGRAADGRRALVGFADGTLALVRCATPAEARPGGGAFEPMQELARVRLAGSYEPRAVRWHPGGAAVAVFFASGLVALLDSALQRLGVVGERGAPSRALPVAKHLPEPAGLVDAAWDADGRRLFAVYERGPLVALDVDCPATHRQAVEAWLRAGRFAEAAALAAAVPGGDAHAERAACVVAVAARACSAGTRADAERALDWAWGERFGRPPAVRALMARRFQRLCRGRRLEDAWFVADRLGDARLLRELERRATAAGQHTLACAATDAVSALGQRDG